ncbi:hypothetical protein, partial [Escherichia coli]
NNILKRKRTNTVCYPLITAMIYKQSVKIKTLSLNDDHNRTENIHITTWTPFSYTLITDGKTKVKTRYAEDLSPPIDHTISTFFGQLWHKMSL